MSEAAVKYVMKLIICASKQAMGRWSWGGVSAIFGSADIRSRLFSHICGSVNIGGMKNIEIEQ